MTQSLFRPAPGANKEQTTTAPAFDQAITYVTKIKQRFEHDPENTYQSFLDILHTFQKKQRSIKDVLDKVYCVG